MRHWATSAFLNTLLYMTGKSLPFNGTNRGRYKNQMQSTIDERTVDASLLELVPDALRQKNYIITPGLRVQVDWFERHCEVSNGKPVLITGSTGTGKSLFLFLYCLFYLMAAEKKLSKIGGKPKKIGYLNCSHFDGEVARSELFGHEKGAFSGAINKKMGWLEQNKYDLLVLDEMGDLPSATQAQLLTYVESGTFVRVGGTEILKSNVAIVGATNRPELLRDDLLYRFFPFSILPLHKRREDILYYFNNEFPELLTQLKPWKY